VATILAHIQLHAGREAEFETLVSQLYRDTARDVGARHYEYWRSATPGFYYCLLAFDDFDAFLAHQTSDHHEVASPKLGELISKMRLEWIDPVPGASALPSTEGQPLAEGADELTSRYHALFQPVMQEWWQPLRAATA
jgi:quinol monooxygenase YgiN